eukprot:2948581-Rhodomonas_salina.3
MPVGPVAVSRATIPSDPHSVKQDSNMFLGRAKNAFLCLERRNLTSRSNAKAPLQATYVHLRISRQSSEESYWSVAIAKKCVTVTAEDNSVRINRFRSEPLDLPPDSPVEPDPVCADVVRNITSVGSLEPATACLRETRSYVPVTTAMKRPRMRNVMTHVMEKKSSQSRGVARGSAPSARWMMS